MWGGLERFERITKYVVALAWGSCELAYWGARPQALAFIGTALGSSEALRALSKLKAANQ